MSKISGQCPEASWTKTRRCPPCGGWPDPYVYEPDEEQAEMGYPASFRTCRTCQAPMLRPRKKPPVRRCAGCKGATGARRYGLCDKCYDSGEYEWCEVCQDWQYTQDEVCRHIFWTTCGYMGSGINEGDWDACREDCWKLLDALAAVPAERVAWRRQSPGDLIAAIEAAIGANAFWIASQWHEIDFHRNTFEPPVVGEQWFARADGDGDYDDDDDEDNRPRLNTELPDGSAEDEWGFGWLRSLDSLKTPEANARTVEWIRLWRAGRRLLVLNAGPRSLEWFRLRHASLRLAVAERGESRDG